MLNMDLKRDWLVGEPGWVGDPGCVGDPGRSAAFFSPENIVREAMRPIARTAVVVFCG